MPNRKCVLRATLCFFILATFAWSLPHNSTQSPPTAHGERSLILMEGPAKHEGGNLGNTRQVRVTRSVVRGTKTIVRRQMLVRRFPPRRSNPSGGNPLPQTGSPRPQNKPPQPRVQPGETAQARQSGRTDLSKVSGVGTSTSLLSVGDGNTDSRRNPDRIPTPGTSNLGANRQDLAELKTGTSASFASVAPINPTLNPNNRNPGSVSFNQDFSRSGSYFSRINPTSASLASVAPNNFNVNPIPTNPTPASISFNQDFSRSRSDFSRFNPASSSLASVAPNNFNLNPTNPNPFSFNQDFSRSRSDFSRFSPASASLLSTGTGGGPVIPSFGFNPNARTGLNPTATSTIPNSFISTGSGAVVNGRNLNQITSALQGSAGSTNLQNQVSSVTRLLGSINGKSGPQVVDAVNRILNIENAENSSRNNIRLSNPNDLQISNSIGAVSQNGPALISSLEKLRNLAASGASPQAIQAQLDVVNIARTPLLQANNDLIQAGRITGAGGTSNADAFPAALRQQFTDVSQSLNSLRGLSGQPVVAEANRILASQQAEIAARNAFLAPRSNDPQVAGTLQNLAAADQNLTGALTRLRDVANDPQAVQQQLKQVNALRQPVAQLQNDLIPQGATPLALNQQT